MASISTDPRGNRVLQFMGADGKRRTIRLGKLPIKQADAIKLRVEIILASTLSGQALDGETAAWVSRLGDDLHAKLASAGVLAARQSAYLGTFLDSYIAGRTDVKKRTTWNLKQAARRIKEFFGERRPMREVTPADADAFAIAMKERYAEATASRTIKRAGQFFTAAIRAKVVTENPFKRVKAGSMANADRAYFVTRDATSKIIDACPDREWRLIVALSRFGGLRCPSETLTLEWTDVNWEQSRFIVRSPKTGSRSVPIFPEILPHLRECFEAAEPGAGPVITRYRDGDQNLRTAFMRIIRRAGLVPWEKPFQNMRASRETELVVDYPLHVVCAWIGNSPAVAAKHYLQVRDEDFERAAKSAATALQKPTLAVFGSNEQDLAQLPEVQPSASFGNVLLDAAKSSKLLEYPRGDSNTRHSV